MTAVYPTDTPLENRVVIQCPTLVPRCTPEPIITTSLDPSCCTPGSGPGSLRMRRLFGDDAPATWDSLLPLPHKVVDPDEPCRAG